MNAALAIAKRELWSYFRVPAGWIVLALFLLMTGAVFSLAVLSPGNPASMRPFFSLAGWLLLPVGPAISMRLLADESRSGTIETLATSPLSSLGLVLGKYLGAMLFVGAMVAPTAVFVVVLRSVAEPAPDLGPIFAGYLCLALLAGLYIAVGVLCSAWTSNATLAFLVTLFVLLGLLLVDALVPYAPTRLMEPLAVLSLPRRVGDFAKGVIDTGHVGYFGAMIGASLALATLVVHARRWR